MTASATEKTAVAAERTTMRQVEIVEGGSNEEVVPANKGTPIIDTTCVFLPILPSLKTWLQAMFE
jgi:hypothetical protein